MGQFQNQRNADSSNINHNMSRKELEARQDSERAEITGQTKKINDGLLEKYNEITQDKYQSVERKVTEKAEAIYVSIKNDPSPENLAKNGIYSTSIAETLLSRSEDVAIKTIARAIDLKRLDSSKPLWFDESISKIKADISDLKACSIHSGKQAEMVSESESILHTKGSNQKIADLLEKHEKSISRNTMYQRLAFSEALSSVEADQSYAHFMYSKNRMQDFSNAVAKISGLNSPEHALTQEIMSISKASEKQKDHLLHNVYPKERKILDIKQTQAIELAKYKNGVPISNDSLKEISRAYHGESNNSLMSEILSEKGIELSMPKPNSIYVGSKAEYDTQFMGRLKAGKMPSMSSIEVDLATYAGVSLGENAPKDFTAKVKSGLNLLNAELTKLGKIEIRDEILKTVVAKGIITKDEVQAYATGKNFNRSEYNTSIRPLVSNQLSEKEEKWNASMENFAKKLSLDMSDPSFIDRAAKHLATKQFSEKELNELRNFIRNKVGDSTLAKVLDRTVAISRKNTLDEAKAA